jgi:hypothetical protein
MKITSQIEQVVTSLQSLKAGALANPSETEKQFNSILEAALNSTTTDNPATIPNAINFEEKSVIPSWVDPNYGYDPSNPRKPNMREMMEALSGHSLEELYSNENLDSKSVSRLASELLYGVVGSNNDTRDWKAIMSSEDLVHAARSATSKMYEPTVDLLSNTNTAGDIIEQIAVLQDKNGVVLRSLTGSPDYVVETLNNFGATSNSIPSDLRSRVVVSDFDDAILNAFEAYVSPIELKASGADLLEFASDSGNLEDTAVSYLNMQLN